MRRIWEILMERRQLSMRDKSSGNVYWKINISLMALFGGAIALIFIIFVVLMLLMAHTSILDIFPSYRTKTESMRSELIAGMMRLDDLERRMQQQVEYNDPVAMIFGSNTPTTYSTTMRDTIRYDKTTVVPSAQDSLLRASMQDASSPYALSNTKPIKRESARFGAPMNGTIIRGFDSPESSFDVVIIPIGSDNTVLAIEGGTVLNVNVDVDGYGVVMIQHAAGYISVYKHLGETLVRKGQRVQSGSVVGRLMLLPTSEAESVELHFELWRDGMAIDPEPYIGIKRGVGDEY